MKWDATPSRMSDAKVKKPRLDRLGPYILYNAERCIMCTRCVRFMEEVAHDRQLGVFNRGDHAEIGVFPGQQLDNPYSLNTVDVCPVGTLTSTVFRFKQRVWNLRRTPSVCGGCARGCSIHVDQRAGNIYRFLPRENEAVNKSWLCDEGRLSYDRANQRLTSPLAKTTARAEEVEPEVARKRAADLLSPVATTRSGLGAALSLHATCEEAYVFGRLVKDVLGGTQVALLEYAAGASDDLLRLADKNPNRAGVTRVLGDLGLAITTITTLIEGIEKSEVKALLIVGHEGEQIVALAKASARLEAFVHIAATRSPLAETAHVTLPTVPWTQLDGTWVNGTARAQHLTPAFAAEGDALPSHQWLLDLASDLGVQLAVPSLLALRNEMEHQLESFADSRLADIPPEGTQLAWRKDA